MPYTPFSKICCSSEGREPEDVESAESQMAAIRKALIAADAPQQDEASSTHTAERTDCEPDHEPVAYYNEGATELFRSIEECDWENAHNILQHHPKQARVWVVSTGTIDTTFNWSLWKRLPIHEAARRQAPAQFVTELIQVYPESPRKVTQFGETPLHLAMECGCEPAVIYLLCVHHWRGLFATDQSGRTPRDVLQEAALLDPSDQSAVLQALESSQQCYHAMQQEHTLELHSLKEIHERGIRAIRAQHDDDLRVEQDNQEKLLKEISMLRALNDEKAQKLKLQEQRLVELQKKDDQWKIPTQDLQGQRDGWKLACEQERASVASLVETVAGRDEQAVLLADQIVDLQVALQRIHTFHQKSVQGQLASVHKQFQKSLLEFSKLSCTLEDHHDDLTTLLHEMDMVAVDDVTNPSESTSAAPRSNEETEEDMMDEEAMFRAARAASNVL